MNARRRSGQALTPAATTPSSPAAVRQGQEADEPPEVTVILPDGPVPLTPHAAKALLAFIRDEYQQRRTVHHSG